MAHPRCSGRVQASCAVQYVSNKLAGAPIYSLPGGRSVVPLLRPQQDGLPFALTLELHSGRAAGAAGPPPPPPTALAPGVYSLHYVLGGTGQLVRAGGSEQLQAGDAVLMQSGAAACCVASAGGGAGGTLAAGDASCGGAPPTDWQLAELVAYMPSQLFQQASAGQQADALRHAGGLQPLLLRGGGVTGHLPEQVTQQLLAGAKETARRALLGGPDSQQQQQQQQQQQGSRQHSGSSDDEGGGGSGAARLPFFIRSAAAALAEWWRQQQGRTCPVTRRTLAELTAFQLPNQTNRLAVQFDPFTHPQVPFISGLEIFERGHKTQPHVHPTAHELFFILAGRGTGFCGAERFPVAAGDVVVFRPGAVHGIDNSDEGRMYCLELMVPNEEFAEMVRAGTDMGHLAQDDLCVLASIGCR